ncbi:alpha/beta fold hydrolase [Amycolatopsis jejuensis]|uniref:alpha/beta fold hydrolase n=1 Tax=Amycolatopsis jejuensis TaxID=330084 RepID=UPI000527A97C|nr:alpha/beta fold hydrolase [Amycolatopsis jejuensis]
MTTIWPELGDLSFGVRYVQVNGWRTRMLEAGEGPPLVLLHGTGGHLEAYARNIAVLARSHRVIAYDFPGQGYTTTASADLEIADYVDHLRALLDVLSITRADLCGESLGGWVAIKFAAAFPERVGKLVLNTPGGTMATPEVMARIRSLSQAAADDPSPERIRSRLEWLMADPQSVTAELVEVRRRIYARPGFATSMRHVLCLQDPVVRRRNLVTDEELASLPGPVLVVWTSDDPSGPARAGLDMVSRLQHGRFALIEGAGHWPQWEQAETYNGVMTEFLARQPASGYV